MAGWLFVALLNLINSISTPPHVNKQYLSVQHLHDFEDGPKRELMEEHMKSLKV